MTRRQARLFAIVSTAVIVVVFIGLTIDSHRQFDELTNADQLTPQVVAGKDVWHKYNCTNCHTLFGEGAYFAPDLTKIAQQRGAAYLRAFLKDPAQFYDENRYRRVMPRQGLSDQEIDDVIVFLTWVANVDNQGWPPRPIIVSGASIPGTDVGRAAHPQPASTDPVALGEALFRSTPPGCFACHSIAPGVNLAGPTLAQIGTRAAEVVRSPQYKGAAQDAQAYIREAIVEPNAYIVPGATFSAGGQSFMPGHYGKELSAEQIDHLVAYLSTLK